MSQLVPPEPALPIHHDQQLIYKQIGRIALRWFIFQPPEGSPDTPYPTIIFFHGGSWTGGDISQFEPQARHFAARGAVCICAEYRVRARHGSSPFESVADAKSAVRYAREHAGQLGIDPQRIVAAGGSAGGHLAACTGVIDSLDEPGEDRSISSRPQAMILYNPPLNTTPEGWAYPGVEPRGKQLADLFGSRGRAGSPLHHVAPGAPPTIIFHGTADPVVPIQQVREFRTAMTRSNNHCRLVECDGQNHGFFNPGRSPDDHWHHRTTEQADAFLVSLEMIEAEIEADVQPGPGGPGPSQPGPSGRR
jgi:acetyl esterase/lipase